VTLTGELAGDHRVMATTILRVIRHKVTAPNGGETLAAGSSTALRWTVPNDWHPHHADVYLSTNGGISWSIIGAGVRGTSFNWVVPNVSSHAALVRVELFDALGAITHDSSDQPFNILPAPTAIDVRPRSPTPDAERAESLPLRDLDDHPLRAAACG
jgi:hypothetical protein